MAAQATDIRFPKAVKVTGEGKEQLALALNLAFIGDFPQGINPTPEGYLVTNSREIIELRTGPDPDWSPLQTSDFSDVAEFIMEWLGKLTPDEQRVCVPRLVCDSPFTPNVWTIQVVRRKFNGIKCRCALIVPA